MTTWYEEKASFHNKQWEAALDSGKDKAAKYHMQEFINYKEMSDNEKTAS